MKKIFVLFATCMMFFACGNANEGVEYIKKAQKAAEQKDWELVQEYMREYAEWCQTATEEQIEEAAALMQKVITEEAQESLENLYNNAADIAEDPSEEIEKALEVGAEKAEAAVEEAMKALEGLTK